MRRPQTNTRGRPSGDDRVYGSTISNTETDAGTISKVISGAGFKVTNEVLGQITAQFNIRIAEATTPFLTWGEVRNAALQFAEGIQNVQEALDQLSSLGQNDVARPLGDHLLGDLQYEARLSDPGERVHWRDCVTFLRNMSDNLESNFVSLGGRAAEHYGFIRWMYDLLQSQIKRGDMVNFVSLMEELDKTSPGAVFPGDTVSGSRRDYVYNALR